MLDLEGTGHNVSGEVFAVDDEMLKGGCHLLTLQNLTNMIAHLRWYSRT